VLSDSAAKIFAGLCRVNGSKPVLGASTHRRVPCLPIMN
jgi:hypothetical protein